MLNCETKDTIIKHILPDTDLPVSNVNLFGSLINGVMMLKKI